jgi:NAD(P)-dependent dehydrogenase (short-subunit alcohol dehydrogenase family)
LLLETLTTSAPARIINVASKGLLTFPGLTVEFDNLNGERKFSATHAYYHSKIAQVMFTYDLAKRLAGTGITVNCIRVTNVALDWDRLTDLPGWMRAMYSLKRRFCITPEKMAETYAYLAASPEVKNVTGKYWNENNRQVTSPKWRARSTSRTPAFCSPCRCSRSGACEGPTKVSETNERPHQDTAPCPG